MRLYWLCGMTPRHVSGDNVQGSAIAASFERNVKMLGRRWWGLAIGSNAPLATPVLRQPICDNFFQGSAEPLAPIQMKGKMVRRHC